MNKIGTFFLLMIGFLLTPITSHAQNELFEEEESAELTMEAYTDEFQEKFFEALKQKGIENYDRAINLLLECKAMGLDYAIVDYELAKAYLASKNYVKAQEHALATLRKRPQDYWVLHTTLGILASQGLHLLDIKQQLPISNMDLKKNAVLIYYQQQRYEAAMEVLKEMEKSSFSTEFTQKIEDSLHTTEQEDVEEVIVPTKEENPMDRYFRLLQDLLSKENYTELQAQSLEAMEHFPVQPYFYYTYGVALHKNGSHKEAISILESGLDFILDDEGLSKKIYQELASAHTALGNSSKANMYLSKLKSGS